MQNQNEAPIGAWPPETVVSRLSLLLWAGITVTVCWSVANMLLAGFVQTPERYPLPSRTLAPRLDGLVDFAVLIQVGPPEWLPWSMLPATFSATLYLVMAFGVYRLMRPGCTTRIGLAMLFFGCALPPLGHASFYFTGMAAKVLPNAAPDDCPSLLALLRRSYRMPAVYWMTSAGSIAAGWLLLLIQTLRRRTLSPHVAVWCNPLPVGTVIAVSCSPFPQSPVAAVLGGAMFNLTQLVFFACAAACARRRGMRTQLGWNETVPPLPDGNLRLGVSACNTGSPPFRPRPITYHSAISSRLGQFFVLGQPSLSEPLGEKAC